MSRWGDLAVWRGPTVNQGGPMVEQRGLVIHIAEGSFEGTISWCKNPDSNVSTHFVTDTDGTIAQMIDTDVTAWTQRAGNGHWLSVENAGHTPAPLTAAQIEACAQLLARGHTQYGYPLQVAVNPDGLGLGHHSMGCNWPDGAWGHCDCPGPAIIAQKPAILARATEIVGGNVTAPTHVAQDEYLGWVIDNRQFSTNRMREHTTMTPITGSDGVTRPGLDEPNDLVIAINGLTASLVFLHAKVDALVAGGVDLALVKAAAHDGAESGAVAGINGAKITGTVAVA